LFYVFSYLVSYYFVFIVLRKNKKNKNKIPKNQKTKNKKQKQKKLPTFEAAVGGNQPPFQVAAAARQPAATHPGVPPLLQNYRLLSRR
jgi:hypothetical protein